MIVSYSHSQCTTASIQEYQEYQEYQDYLSPAKIKIVPDSRDSHDNPEVTAIHSLSTPRLNPRRRYPDSGLAVPGCAGVGPL